MKTIVIGLVIFIIARIPAGAIAEDELRQLKGEYQSQRQKLVGDYAAGLEDNARRYVEALGKLQKTLNEKGDAKGALAVAGELDRFERERKTLLEATETAVLVLQTVERRSHEEVARLRSERDRAASEAVRAGQSARSEDAGISKKIASGTSEAGVKVTHAGVGAEVSVSSTHLGEPGEGSANALVDGDMFTRWSSDYASPQEVTFRFARPLKLSKLRLHWEKAAATKYCVYVSGDGKSWASTYLYMNFGAGEPAARIDEIDMKDASASWLKLDLQDCVNKEWGFSLYEVEALESGSAELERK